MGEKIKINRIKAVLAKKDISTRICNNESQPTLKLLREIALALEVDIRSLPERKNFSNLIFSN